MSEEFKVSPKAETLTIVENSPYYGLVLELIDKGLNYAEIHKEVVKRGYKVSYWSIKESCKKVQRRGTTAVSATIKENEKTAYAFIDQLKEYGPSMGSVVDRRNKLITDLMERRQILIDRQDENKVKKELLKKIDIFRSSLKQVQDPALRATMEADIKTIHDLVQKKLTNVAVQTSVENTILQYTTAVDNILRYVEQWVSKYDVYILIEEITKKVAEAAANAFSVFITDRKVGEQAVAKFEQECMKILDEVKKSKIDTAVDRNNSL